MKPVIVSEEEVPSGVLCQVEDCGEAERLSLDAGERSVIPVFLHSYLPSERLDIGIASRSPFFFESMLREADVSFMYGDVEAPPTVDRSYSSMARCSLDPDELEDLFAQFRRISSMGIYDFHLEWDEGTCWFGEGSWLAYPKAMKDIREAAERFADRY